MVLAASRKFLYLCCVPTGKAGEYDCSLVLNRKKGEPAIAPAMPERAPETMLIGMTCLDASPVRNCAPVDRIGS